MVAATLDRHPASPTHRQRQRASSIPVSASEPRPPEPSGAVRRQTLEERYGVESPTRRRTKQVAVAAVVLALLGWLGWAAWEHSQADVTGRLQTFDVIDEHEVRIGVVLTRNDGQAVACDVIAQADDHTTVGEGTVTAPPGPSNQLTATATVRTDREATTATVSNCRTAD
jgi:hypothetical protein